MSLTFPKLSPTNQMMTRQHQPLQSFPSFRKKLPQQLHHQLRRSSSPLPLLLLLLLLVLSQLPSISTSSSSSPSSSSSSSSKSSSLFPLSPPATSSSTLSISSLTSLSLPSTSTHDICTLEAFGGSCGDGDDDEMIVVVAKALYGRMKIGRCVQEMLGFQHCYKNVKLMADYMCSGQSQCTIKVPNGHMDATKPCNVELKSYLEIGYVCLKVHKSEQDRRVCLNANTNKSSSNNKHNYYNNNIINDINNNYNKMHVGSTPAYISHHITSANDNNNFTNINNINKNIILNNNNIDNNINIRSHSNGSSNYKIASIATSTSTAASANNCKQSIYTLDALPGQRIRISITDFTRWIPTDRSSLFNDEYDVAFNDGGDDQKLVDDHDDDDDDNRSVRNKLCEHDHLKAGSTIYGYIIDSKTKDNKTICRTKNDMTMTSSGSSVELLLMNYHQDERYDGSFKILIQYRAIGCPDLTPPSTAWFRRVNDTCEVGCYDTDQSWHLICIHDQWHGVLGNCSTNKGGMRFQRMSDQNFSNGIMILLVIGCSLVIALVIILVGVAYVKSIRSLTEMDYKRWKKEQQLLQQQQQQQQQQHTFPQQYQQHLMMTNVDKEAYLLSDPFVANKFQQQQQQQHLYPPMNKPLPNDKIDNNDLCENSGGVFYDATTQQQPQQQLQQKFINTNNSNNNPQQNDFNCIIVDHLNEYSQILDPPADLTRKSNFTNNINNNITINNNISNKNVAPFLPPPLPTTLPASLANDPSSQNSSNPSSANNKIKDDNRFNKSLLT